MAEGMERSVRTERDVKGEVGVGLRLSWSVGGHMPEASFELVGVAPAGAILAQE